MQGPVQKLLAALGVAGVALSVAACGGGSSSALSAADLRTQADAICKKADQDIEALGSPNSVDDLKSFVPKALAAGKTQIDSLKALKAPSELKGDWDSALSLLDKQYAALSAAGVKIAAGEDPVATITAAQAASKGNEAELQAKAKAIGLTECGNDSNNTSSGTDTTGTETSTDSTTTSTDSGSVGDTGSAATFAADTTTFGTALQAWGTLVTTVNSGSDITNNLDELRGDTDKAEAALSKMGGYTLDDATLETKRSAIVSKGQDLTKLMRELEDKGPTNSDTEMTDLVSRFQSAVEDFKAEVGS